MGYQGPAERVFFEAFQAHLNEVGTPSQVKPPEGSAPFYGLITQLQGFGAGEQALNFEFSAPPGVSDPESGTFLCQIFVVLASGISQDTHQAVSWLNDRLNSRVSLGAFGLVEENGTLYYKQGTVVDGELDTVAQVRGVDRQIGLMIHMLQTFTDLLLAVKDGADPAEALGEHPLARAFAQAG